MSRLTSYNLNATSPECLNIAAYRNPGRRVFHRNSGIVMCLRLCSGGLPALGFDAGL